MNHRWKRFVIGSLCLATLLLASGTPLKSHAAARTLLQPGDYFCTPTDPRSTGVSYDATSYELDDNANETAILGDFSFNRPGSPGKLLKLPMTIASARFARWIPSIPMPATLGMSGARPGEVTIPALILPSAIRSSMIIARRSIALWPCSVYHTRLRHVREAVRPLS